MQLFGKIFSIFVKHELLFATKNIPITLDGCNGVRLPVLCDFIGLVERRGVRVTSVPVIPTLHTDKLYH